MKNALETNLTPEKYIEERVNQYQSWYDKKAVISKSRYLNMRAFAVLGGGIVPILININSPNYEIWIKLIVTIISLLVVVTVSLESVYHYREQWKNYRSTEQLLGHEKFLFKAGVGPYYGLDSKEAFLHFVERIEDAIASENTATLNVMTLANEANDTSLKKVISKKEIEIKE